MAVHRNGSNGNGRVEPANLKGYHQEAAQGQQSLFSWAEFMAGELAEKQGRNGKPKPSSLSLFKWALNAEQDREKEAASAGR